MPLMQSTQVESRPAPFLQGRGWLVVALSIALTLQVVTVTLSPLTAPDSFVFVQYARQLAETPIPTIRDQAQHPGFPMLILAAHEVTERLISGDAAWLAAARLVCGLGGLACVWLVWRITRHVSNPSVAGAAAMLFALLPAVRQNAADALSDQPHLMLYLGAVLLVCQATAQQSLWKFVLAGSVSGAAFWVRPEGLAVALVAAFGVCVLPVWRTELGTRRAFAASGALLAGAALIVAPYMVISGPVTAKLRQKPGWSQADVAPRSLDSRPAGESLDGSRVASERPPKIPLAGPTPWNDPLPSALLAAVARFCTRLAENFNGILLVPLFIGIPLAASRMPKSSVAFFVLLALAQISLLLLLYRLGGYIDRRHQFPLLAILMPSVGTGAVVIIRWMREVTHRHRQVAWVLPTLVACTLAILLPRAMRPLHQNRLHMLDAAAWLRGHISRDDRIGSNAIEVIHHATLDGRAHPGSVLHTGLPLDADGPLRRDSLLVLEFDEQNALPEWSSRILPEFSPVMTIHGHPRLRQRDIVIYRRNPSVRTAAALRATVN